MLFNFAYRLIRFNHNLTNVTKIAKLINNNKALTNNNDNIKRIIPEWQKQKLAVNKKINNQRWNPSKKLSRTTMEAIRLLKRQFPNMNASELGERFKVSPEVIRRILKSKWQPDTKEQIKVEQRWLKRKEKIMSNAQELYARKKVSIKIDSAGKQYYSFKSLGNKQINEDNKIKTKNKKKMNSKLDYLKITF